MATIAELMVKVDAQNKGLVKTINSSESKIDRFVKTTVKRLAIISTVGLAGAVAGFTGLLAIINSTAASIDKLAKTSTKLGLSVAELQKLQYQASLTGVSAETLNMALQRMVRRIAEAAQGTGEAVSALKELGLDAAILNKMNPAKQFFAVAAAMKNIGNQGDKVRLAMKLFDSEGVALVNTLSSNLKKSGEEFESLGVKITEFQARAVESFNDSVTKLTALWEGFKIQLTAAVAPALQLVVDKIVSIVKQSGGIGNVAKSAAIAVISGVKGIIIAISGAVSAVNKLINAFKILSKLAAPFKIAGKSIGAGAALLNPFAPKGAGAIGLADVGKEFKNTFKAPKLDNTFNPKPTVDILNNLEKSLSAGQDVIRKSNPTSGNKPGFGTISDVKTGRQLTTGGNVTVSPVQTIDVNINVSNEGIVQAVVQNPKFQDNVKVQVNQATKEAARATRR